MSRKLQRKFVVESLQDNPTKSDTIFDLVDLEILLNMIARNPDICKQIIAYEHNLGEPGIYEKELFEHILGSYRDKFVLSDLSSNILTNLSIWQSWYLINDHQLKVFLENPSHCTFIPPVSELPADLIYTYYKYCK